MVNIISLLSFTAVMPLRLHWAPQRTDLTITSAWLRYYTTSAVFSLRYNAEKEKSSQSPVNLNLWDTRPHTNHIVQWPSIVYSIVQTYRSHPEIASYIFNIHSGALNCDNRHDSLQYSLHTVQIHLKTTHKCPYYV